MTDSTLPVSDPPITTGGAAQFQNRSVEIDLFIASFVALFLELTLIRWIPSYERVLAYFSNFVLIGAFLGLGLGAMLGRVRRDWMRLQPWLILAIVMISLFFHHYVKTSGVAGDIFYTDSQRTTMLTVFLPECLILFFALMTVVFIPLGHRIGKDLGTVMPPLRGYILNLLGSLLGVVAFTALAFLELAPQWWFIISLAGLLWFVRGEKWILVANAVASLLVIVMVWTAGADYIWTPYNKLLVRQIFPITEGSRTEGYRLDTNQTISVAQMPFLRQGHGFGVAVNDDFYQMAEDLSAATAVTMPFITNHVRRYEMPYAILGTVPEDVLVVGAGTGNDVAGALRRGAHHVDAVEIDPGIARLGYLGHPEQPYSDPRVNVIIDDARSYFNSSPRKYDVIVFGLLDSHRLFSGMSSVRLDSFVYTVESFQEARRLLKDNGLVFVSHAQGNSYLTYRLDAMLGEAFGTAPEAIDFLGLNFVIGPGLQRRVTAKPPRRYPGLDLATDDWPFFYMAGRSMPQEYRFAIESLLMVAGLFVFIFFEKRTRSFNLHFFALGASFMLIETVSITRFAMLFGSTWVVSAIVFIAILALILVANIWLQQLEKLHLNVLYALLGVAVLVNYFFPVQDLLRTIMAVRLIISMFLMGAPIFFAAVIFARSYRSTKDPAVAFASNLLGAVIGGLLEYSALVFGFRSQLLLALALYGLSWVALHWSWRPRLAIANQ